MIVEDDIIVLEGLKSIVSKLGYTEVYGVVDAASAISILEQNAVDFVFLDIDIEGDKDGIWLATFINKHYGIPFVYTTGNDDVKTIQTAVETNPCSYLIKPFKEKDIVSAIEMVKQRQKTKKIVTKTSDKKNEVFLLHSDDYEKYDFESILFVEKVDNGLKVYTQFKTRAIAESLIDLKKKLPSQFFQVHPFFIVNTNEIIKIGVNFIILKDNFYIPIDLALKSEIMERLKITT